MSDNYPILEFDPSREAHIEPSRLIQPIADIPACCVLCFFPEVFKKLCGEERLTLICNMSSELGDRPVYRMELEGRPVVVAHPGIGGPMAAAMLEEIIALGCRRYVACGGAGVLQSDIVLGHIVVPTSAVRDEGTSYHYLPPGREVSPGQAGVEAIEQVLKGYGIPYTSGKTWTTDGVYRETPAKIQRRKEEGCITVEMEAAAFFAVAQFRGVTFAQMLYGGDDVGGAEWDSRGWDRDASMREKLFWLAVEACLAIE